MSDGAHGVTVPRVTVPRVTVPRVTVPRVTAAWDSDLECREMDALGFGRRVN